VGGGGREKGGNQKKRTKVEAEVGVSGRGGAHGGCSWDRIVALTGEKLSALGTKRLKEGWVAHSLFGRGCGVVGGPGGGEVDLGGFVSM